MFLAVHVIMSRNGRYTPPAEGRNGSGRTLVNGTYLLADGTDLSTARRVRPPGSVIQTGRSSYLTQRQGPSNIRFAYILYSPVWSSAAGGSMYLLSRVEWPAGSRGDSGCPSSAKSLELQHNIHAVRVYHEDPDQVWRQLCNLTGRNIYRCSVQNSPERRQESCSAAEGP